METIIDNIRRTWIKELENRKSPVNIQSQIQHNIQDLGFIVSQLIEPTISILVQFAMLYICLQNGKKANQHEESRIQKSKDTIKEVLDNYNIEIENIDNIINTIITKLEENN